MSGVSLRYTAMAIPWQPSAIAAGVSLALVATDRVPFVMATILLSTATAYCLDDPAHAVTAASARSLMRRRIHRVVVVLAPMGAVWAGLAVWQGPRTVEEAWGLLAMFFGLTTLSLGIAGSVADRSAGSGGQIAAPTILVLLILSSIMSPHWRPMPLGDVPGGWPQVYLRWGLVGVAGIALLVRSSRNTARP